MNLASSLEHPVFRHIGRVADEMGREVYVVGGYVRDIFLDRPSVDIDFVTVGSGIELASAVAESLGRSKHLTVYASYGTAQVRHGDLELEFVGAPAANPIRGEPQPYSGGRDTRGRSEQARLHHQRHGHLSKRGKIRRTRGPFGGIADIEARTIRTPLDPDITFSDDPLRMMRAIRFATQLGFKIHPETFQAISRNSGRMGIITKERINDELSKIIRAPRPSDGFKLLDRSGLLEIIFPSLAKLKGVAIQDGKGHKDNFNHTLQVLDNVAAKSDNEWLRWATLLHDIGKPSTKRYDERLGWTFHNHNYVGEKMIPGIFRQMKLPMNEKMKYVAKIVGLHMRPQSVGESGVSDSGVRRLITDAGPDLEDLMTLAEADITSKNPAKVRRQLEGFSRLRERMAQINDADELRNWKNPVNGDELMEHFGLPAGRWIQGIKEAVKEAVMEGTIPYDHDSAWKYAPP